tara:strand:- start:157 stop:612 length:456 start_codon:yes stop_codon:yes gene_type:complete
MKNGRLESVVGIFMLAGIIAVSYVAIKLGGIDLFDDSTYILEARFKSTAGLKKGSQVMVSGVAIGQIEKIDLDTKEFVSIVTFRIPKNVTLDDDTIASVKSSGLIGDKFLGLSPGGSGVALEPGERIVDTESALDIEGLIAKFGFGSVGDE